MDFIKNYGGTVLILLLVCALLFFAIRKMIRDKKSGKSSCQSCEGCMFKDNCHKK